MVSLGNFTSSTAPEAASFKGEADSAVLVACPFSFSIVNGNVLAVDGVAVESSQVFTRQLMAEVTGKCKENGVPFFSIAIHD